MNLHCAVSLGILMPFTSLFIAARVPNSQVSVELAGFAAPGLSLLPVREQQCQEHFVPPPAPTSVPHLNLGEIKPGRGKGLAPRGFSQKTEGNKEQAAPSEPPMFHQFLLNSANLPQIESLQLLPGSRQLN